MYVVNKISKTFVAAFLRKQSQSSLPPELNTEKRQEMVHRFGGQGWVVQISNPSNGRRLFYNPNARINLEVIPHMANRRFPRLDVLYNDVSAGALVGQTKFFQ